MLCSDIFISFVAQKKTNYFCGAFMNLQQESLELSFNSVSKKKKKHNV